MMRGSFPRRALRLGLVVALVACGSGAPGGEDATETNGDDWVVDTRGVALSTAVSRQRVISLIPSVTEIIVAMGGANQLAGRTRYDRDPQIAALPLVGGALDANTEIILALEPDLVIVEGTGGGQGLVHQLTSSGVPTFSTHVRSIDAFRPQALLLGKLLGREREADSLATWVDTQLEELRVDMAERDRASVLFVVWPDPLLTTGAGTFVDDLTRLVGARSLFGDLNLPCTSLVFKIRGATV